MQRMLSYIRKAIDDYNMIDNGDKIPETIIGLYFLEKGIDNIYLLVFYSLSFIMLIIKIKI